jgi:signal transduction histidine kinase
VRADAGRLEQVFVNLLANAIEHAGTSTIDVSVRRSGSFVTVEVRDHGSGIPSNVLPQLFQPYALLGQKPSAGLGLGLYLAREIVTAHGGSIDAASSLGEGTTIVVRLPAGKPKESVDAGIGSEAGEKR